MKVPFINEQNILYEPGVGPVDFILLIAPSDFFFYVRVSEKEGRREVLPSG